VLPTTRAGFDQVVISDWRGDTSPVAFDQVTQSDWSQPLVDRPMAASKSLPAVLSSLSLTNPPDWHGQSMTGASLRFRRPMSVGRGMSSLVGLLIVVIVAVGGLVNYVNRSQSTSGSDYSGPDVTQTISIEPPTTGDLMRVRELLVELVAVKASLPVSVSIRQTDAARRARAVRRDLIVWRDQFQLTRHQTRVVDAAIAYAGALARWLKAPTNATRHAAALKDWRAWRARDPLLTGT
jgi:hypothetical protein